MSNAGWTTVNELDYIKGLISGKVFNTGESLKLKPRALVQNYLRSAKKRKAWETFGSVDPDCVIKFAEEYLNCIPDI